MSGVATGRRQARVTRARRMRTERAKEAGQEGEDRPGPAGRLHRMAAAWFRAWTAYWTHALNVEDTMRDDASWGWLAGLR